MKLFDLFKKRSPIIGLALSGGATLGAAHIGVLQVLEREGIRPQFVAGTSAGALVGAAYCAGVPLEELSRLFQEMKWPTLIKFSFKNTLSLFDTQPMEEFLIKKIGDCNFSDLEIPFAAIACDIITGERVVLKHGPLAPAIRASAAVPGMFSPIEIDGHLLVDGAIVDYLPVEQVKAMGSNFVIASDVSIRGKLSEPPGNSFEVLMSSFYIMQERSAIVDSDACDCCIRPDVSQYSSWGFGDAAKVLLAGAAAAEAALPQLKHQLKY
jgi:NTE family protein